ncbi:kunitz trypsin inhibitor 5-like [Andrographis paniculata]|uniref:kunitz trypsin inhibitor 5-like n=1 Tax=Andrographis paniculata TaxID=175694 RepID=UPI0021E7487E|nr:kunitz trypsin inhibitor 5-like [Andrographis paniculata]
MKSLHIVLFLLLLLFPFTYKTIAQLQQDNLVRDHNGKPLEVTGKYFIVATKVVMGLSRKLTLSIYLEGNCRNAVTLAQAFQPGIPCSFHHAKATGDSYIHILKSLNVKFETDTPSCANSTVWRISDPDDKTHERVVRIGGVLGSPGCSTSRNWFKIMTGDSPNTYKIVSHPKDVCASPGAAIFHNLRLNFHPFKRPLVRSDDLNGFEVYFVEA